MACLALYFSSRVRGAAAAFQEACRLDPGVSSITEMRLVADQNTRAHLPHLVLSLRSEYLQAGESAVSGTPEQVAEMFETLDGFFRYAVDSLRAQPFTMTAYAENYLRPGQATG